jgi:hypothetical protein
MSRTKAKGLPAKLPRATRSRPAIEQHKLIAGIEPQAPQIEGDGESGLTGADDDN